MRSKVVFMKSKENKSSFAKIEIEASESDIFKIKWPEEYAEFKLEYGEAVKNGIEYAFEVRSKIKGKKSFKFSILDFVELIVDTNIHAVQCAATVAAWEAMGENIKNINYYYDHHWNVEIILK